jgi:hypothetical protein
MACTSETCTYHAVAFAVGLARRAGVVGLALAVLTSLAVGALLPTGATVLVVRVGVLQECNTSKECPSLAQECNPLAPYEVFMQFLQHVTVTY